MAIGKEKILTRIFEACDFRNGEVVNRGITSAAYEFSDYVKIIDSEKLSQAMNDFLISKNGEGLSQRWLLMIIRQTLHECDKKSIVDIDCRVDEFLKNLKSLNTVDYIVTRTFHGVIINDFSGPVKIGPLIIYQLPRHKDEFIEQLPNDGFSRIQSVESKRTIIKCTVKCRDPEKALELADAAFNSFENFIAFLLGELHSTYSIGILRMRFSPYQNTTVSSEYGIFSGDEVRKQFKGDLDISTLSKYLPREMVDFFDVLARIVLNYDNNFEKRISTAVEWLGESYSDNNLSSAYLKTVIALEALLKIDDKSIITPSIMSSIAEQCAYINGESTKECIEIEKKVKSFYAMRSKIAHAGSKSVTIQQLQIVRSFVRCTILKLFYFTQVENISELSCFNNVLREKKYKSGGIINEKMANNFNKIKH